MLQADYIRSVADAYTDAPITCSEAPQAWRALALETTAMYERIELALDIQHSSLVNPYPTAYAMLADIAQGRLVVSVANCEHPLWSREENIRFRVVHDVVGHASTGGGFDWQGEVKAYTKHATHIISPKARLALFTEAVGQVAYQVTNGYFGPQKCAILPQYLLWSDHV